MSFTYLRFNDAHLLNTFRMLQTRLYVRATSLRQLSRIAKAILAMEGRVTLLVISRLPPGGGSYRPVQRFFHTVLSWVTMLWVFFREHWFNKDDIYLLAGDAVIVTKSGKETHSVERVFPVYIKSPCRVCLFSLYF